MLQKIHTFYAIFTGSMDAKHKKVVTVYRNILHILECICGEFESKIQSLRLTRLTAAVKSFCILSSSSKTSKIDSKSSPNMNSASTSSAILLYDVQGQDHVMDPFNLKSEAIGRPFEVCRVRFITIPLY